MKKYIALAAFAAILLCGCADNKGTPSTDKPTSSSYIPEGGTTSYSDSNSAGRLTINMKRVSPSDSTFSFSYNNHVYIVDGGELKVKGKFDSKEASEITIENGGALVLNGESSLNCNLHIERGGKLVVGENGFVFGSGTIFAASYDCIENSGRIDNRIVITG